jgi:hypothetical protein
LNWNGLHQNSIPVDTENNISVPLDKTKKLKNDFPSLFQLLKFSNRALVICRTTRFDFWHEQRFSS